MEKINIAELLKDCPRGMELDCTAYEGIITLDEVTNSESYPIRVNISYDNGKFAFATLSKYGQTSETTFNKCIIFPKGKTTWEGFVPPCEFKDGDIIFAQYYDLKYVSIVKQIDKSSNIHVYCLYGFTDSVFAIDEILGSLTESFKIRFATDEEKQKLFDAIKANGYHWNTKTKTLEKLPKFKVGDTIRHKSNKVYCKLGEYSEGISAYRTNIGLSLTYKDLEQWELVPNKFDITTLKEFDSRVLVRMDNCDLWRPALFGFVDKSSGVFYVLGGNSYSQCIPYDRNEHLRGTTNDCDDFYKTWE